MFNLLCEIAIDQIVLAVTLITIETQHRMSSIHIPFSNLVLIDSDVVTRTSLEDYVSFSCDLSKIHNAAKRAGMSSLNNDISKFFFHDSNVSERSPYHNNGNVQDFIACHTVIAVYNKGKEQSIINIDSANSSKQSVGTKIQDDDSLMLSIFKDCITTNYSDVMASRTDFAKQYYNVLINNNYVLGELESYQGTKDASIDKADLLAFMLAKLRVLDDENQYYPTICEMYANLITKFQVGSIWRFAKLHLFDSNNLGDDVSYSLDHSMRPVFVGDMITMMDQVCEQLRKDPFQKYLKPVEKKDCIIL